MLLGLFFFFLATSLAASDTNKVENARTAKTLTFNSLSNNIGVSLDFSIPFINIPLKKNSIFPHNLQMALPKINIDPTSIAFGGAMVVVTGLLASIFGKGLSPHYLNRYNRRDDNYLTDTILDMSKMLASSSYSCPSRLACWASRRSDEVTIAGWKEMTRNKLLATLFNTTQVEKAFRVGREGGDCEAFAPCPLKEEQFFDFLNNFLKHKRVDI